MQRPTEPNSQLKSSSRTFFQRMSDFLLMGGLPHLLLYPHGRSPESTSIKNYTNYSIKKWTVQRPLGIRAASMKHDAAFNLSHTNLGPRRAVENACKASFPNQLAFRGTLDILYRNAAVLQFWNYKSWFVLNWASSKSDDTFSFWTNTHLSSHASQARSFVDVLATGIQQHSYVSCVIGCNSITTASSCKSSSLTLSIRLETFKPKPSEHFDFLPLNCSILRLNYRDEGNLPFRSICVRHVSKK